MFKQIKKHVLSFMSKNYFDISSLSYILNSLVFRQLF